MAWMYVVIMAGGGGTRLRPRAPPGAQAVPAAAPDGRDLLQRTVRRLDGPELGPVDVYVVASAAMTPLIEAQVPEARLVIEPEGRNTAAAIALAALAIDRPDDDVMVVLPADHRIDPDREGTFRGVLAAAARSLAAGAFGVERPLVTLGIEPTGRRPSTATSSRGPGDASAGSTPTRSRRSRRSRCRPRHRPVRMAGRRLERGHVPVAPATRSATRSRRWGLVVAAAVARLAEGVATAYEAIQPALDRLRGHGGAAAAGWRRHGVDGRRLVGHRVVDGAARGARRGRGIEAGVVEAGETIGRAPTTWSADRADRRRRATRSAVG